MTQYVIINCNPQERRPWTMFYYEENDTMSGKKTEAHLRKDINQSLSRQFDVYQLNELMR